MDRLEIDERVRRALDVLFARDDALLRREGAEWSIAHRLALYIEEGLPGWNVDCEFNRQGPDGDKKRTSTGNLARPDIIVHHRGRVEKEHNLLVIELKYKTSDKDSERAREYTAPPKDRREFQYQFGLTVVLGGGVPALTWFEGGKQCSGIPLVAR
jgi:hypothetical protein